MSLIVPTRRFEALSSSGGKFWEFQIISETNNYRKHYSVECLYGRKGTRGTRSSHKTTTLKLAKIYAESKIQERLLKGYSEVPNPILAQSSSAGMGTKDGIKRSAGIAADTLMGTIPAGVKAEVIVTVIVDNEIIQEVRK